jgi:hypothetical protein
METLKEEEIVDYSKSDRFDKLFIFFKFCYCFLLLSVYKGYRC